jgi:phage terminase large subunit
MGVSWLAMALSCTLCLFNEGIAIGFGSRKTEYVDKIGTLKPLLPKGRMFMENLPVEFRGGWQPVARRALHADHLPGDRLADRRRGRRRHRPRRPHVDLLRRRGRASGAARAGRGLALADHELPHRHVLGARHGESVRAKRWAGKIEVFIFDWRDDPRKDQAWYDKQCAELDPVVVAQEIDRDYSASVKRHRDPGRLGALGDRRAEKLGIAPAGPQAAGVRRRRRGRRQERDLPESTGTEILMTEEWSGKGGDIFESTEYVFDLCDEHGLTEFRYDADGIGAGVRGDARVSTSGARRPTAPDQRDRLPRLGGRLDPEGIVEGTIGREGDKGRTNEDYFAEPQGAGWWALRKRFQRTHRWVVDGIPCDPTRSSRSARSART